MIQRKQTLFLLFSAIATAVLIYSDIVEFVGQQASFVLKYNGIFAISPINLVQSAYPLTILVLGSTFVSAVTLLLFKKRPLQLRLCGANIALLLGIAVVIFYFSRLGQQSLQALVVYKWVVVLPFVALVLNVLAFMAIAKDEALVRSVKRLRD